VVFDRYVRDERLVVKSISYLMSFSDPLHSFDCT
jgi:hypothetical protein